MSIYEPYSLMEAYYGVYADYLEEQVIDEALTGSRLRRANLRIKQINQQLQEPGNKTNPSLLQLRSALDRVSRAEQGSFDPIRTDNELDFKGPRGRGGRGFRGGPKTVGAAGALDRPTFNKSTQSVLKSIRRKKKNIPEDYDLYDLVLDHLLDEGYAEDLEDAIDLIEELDDEEIEGILDEANRAEQRVGGKGLSPILVRSLRNRTYSGETDPNVELKYDDKIMKQHPYYASKHVKGGQKSLKSHLHPRAEAHTARRGVKKVRGMKESFDLYDLVLDHLLDEGYASTEHDAIQIMSNMSEEWVDEIIDEASEIMTVTSPKGEKRKVNRQNRRHPLAQAARKLVALQKRQALNPRAMGPRSARNQAANEFETNAKKSIYRLNADPNSERDTITPFGRAGYSLADRETHLANVRRKARARKGRD